MINLFVTAIAIAQSIAVGGQRPDGGRNIVPGTPKSHFAARPAQHPTLVIRARTVKPGKPTFRQAFVPEKFP
jgi:hypothetical protein